MRVLMCTGHDEAYGAMAAITLPSVRAYCKKHGYYLLYDPSRDDKDACKVDLYKVAFNSGQFGTDDVFCWIDTDALIMNSERRIESIVYEHMPRSVHYLIGTDVNGLNTGVFIARFTPEAYLFMMVYDTIGGISGWSDQEPAIQTAIKEPHRSIYKEIPGRVFNSNLYSLKGWDFGEYGKYINEYQEGDLVLHLAGVDEPLRTETLKAYAARAK